MEGAGLAVPSTGHPDEPVADDCSELGSETGDLNKDVDMFECELEEDLIFIGSCSDFTPCTAGFYPVQAVTWEDLRAVRARLGPIDQAGSGPEWSVAPTGVQSAAQPAVASPSENPEASDPDDSSSEGSTTSQNESSGSSEEQSRETALLLRRLHGCCSTIVCTSSLSTTPVARPSRTAAPARARLFGLSLDVQATGLSVPSKQATCVPSVWTVCHEPPFVRSQMHDRDAASKGSNARVCCRPFPFLFLSVHGSSK